jgi:hypothetical protein
MASDRIAFAERTSPAHAGLLLYIGLRLLAMIQETTGNEKPRVRVRQAIKKPQAFT